MIKENIDRAYKNIHTIVSALQKSKLKHSSFKIVNCEIDEAQEAINKFKNDFKGFGTIYSFSVNDESTDNINGVRIKIESKLKDEPPSKLKRKKNK